MAAGDTIESEPRLKKNVLLAYSDIAAAGSRALYGVTTETTSFPMKASEILDPRLACEGVDITESTKPVTVFPLQVFNCSKQEFSIVIINTVLHPSNCHYIANTIIDLCVDSWETFLLTHDFIPILTVMSRPDCRKLDLLYFKLLEKSDHNVLFFYKQLSIFNEHHGVQTLTVLSVLRLDLAMKPQQTMYENCFFTKPETDHACLPDDTRVNDPLLNSLIQMIQLERIPTRLLVIPGHAARHGTASEADGSEQAIKLFQETISNLTGLEFNKDYSLAMVYKGRNEEQVDMASMIYM